MANKAFVFTNVRILYPSILRPKPTYAGDGEEYGFVMLVPKKDKAQLARFKKFYDELVELEFKGNKPANLRPPVGSPMAKAVLKDGDEKYASVDIDRRPNYEAYKDHYYANLAVNALDGKIEAVDADKQPIISTDQLVNGAWGNVVAECSAYRSQKFGPQFTVRPILVQVTDNSDPLGVPRMKAEDALDLLPGEETAEDKDFDLF